ncbi:MAG: FtsX-like permease family protein [Candidatus Nealsonbacteria bacterium]|nr:FtsX-like permease family protein [Candidatus Nealsonbacteria bacterium]
MFISLKRILRGGLLNFRRNQGLAGVTIFVMVLTISLMTSIFLFRGMSSFLMDSLEKKFDISVYFKEDSLETEILKTKDLLLELPEVKAVDYISRDQALEIFKEKNKDNQTISQALDEVGDNPFSASLNIRAGSPSNYETVNRFLQNTRFESLIEKVDYYQRKPVIESFYSLIDNLQKTGLVLTLVLAFIAFSLTFVTIRLAIYNASEEIGIMRLVGASNWFIRGPFLVQGIICGLLASLISLILFLALSYSLSPKILYLTSGFSLSHYFIGNFFTVFALQILSGAGLGVFSSLIAIRRYLDK